MMKKMGWSEGQPLGRMGNGVTEPIPMSVKVDRAGGLLMKIGVDCKTYDRA